MLNKYLCSCNCGKELSEKAIKRKRKYIRGHSSKGRKISEITRSKISLSEKGKKISDETKNKLRIANLGKIFSAETKNKLKITNSGINNGFYGKHHTEETKMKMKGKKFSEEHRLKIRNKLKGIKKNKEFRENLRLKRIGKKHSEETKKKIKIARARFVVPIKDTSIEVKIQNYLKELNIFFEKHKYMHIQHGYQCDIFIPSMNLVIECDGDYWHGNINKYSALSEKQLKSIEIDGLRTSELLSAGFKVLRLWEHEIRALTKDDLINKISSINTRLQSN